MTTQNLLDIPIGTEVKTTKAVNGWDKGAIVSREARPSDDPSSVAFTAGRDGDYGYLDFGDFDFIDAEPVESTRPLVHFDDEKAGRDRSKARDACREAVSRTLKPEHNTRLRNAADGHSVDAYDLNEAITAAIRSAATRHGQSTARRVQAKRFAHVAHIVQAVLENHADNLPAYEQGERSRAVEYAKTVLAEARTEVDNLTSTVLTLRSERRVLTQAASDERRRLVGDIDSHLALVKDLKERVRSLEAEVDDNHAQAVSEGQTLYREINEQAAALAYAFTLLNDEQQSRLAGFRDGWQDRANQD